MITSRAPTLPVVRFDFIRFDQNQFKDVIKVEKPVKGIAVDSRAALLYFAHTAAPVYRVVYDDKTSVEVDAKSGQEVVGWKDGEGQGIAMLSSALKSISQSS